MRGLNGTRIVDGPHGAGRPIGSRVIGYLRTDVGVRVSGATASTPHAQHGTGVFVGLEREVVVTNADGAQVSGRVVVVPPHAVHAVDSPGATLGVLHDPEAASALAGFAHAANGGRAFAVDGALAAWLLDAVSAHRASLARSDVLFGLAAESAAALVRAGGSSGSMRPLDRRVAHVLAALRAPDADRRRAVAETGLSEAHLQALFVRDVGLPIRSYLLWRRLMAAVLAFDRTDATRAAHGAGFADLAHFSRTCRRLLGYSPTALRDGP